MNRVLVTGLALGKEVGACDACDFDFHWLIECPSVLVWADKILVTRAIWDVVAPALYPARHSALAKTLQLVFDMSRAEGLIEVVDPTQIISPTVSDSIFAQVEKDRTLLISAFPDHIRPGNDERVPGEIYIDSDPYCSPRIWSIYAGLLLARAWKAQCLFDSSVFRYCRYKFGLGGVPKEGQSGVIESFETVFRTYLPSRSILPKYVLGDKTRCSSCVKERQCKDEYLSQVEASVKELFSWRNYDEIHQLKAVVNRVIREVNKSEGLIHPRSVARELAKTRNELTRRVQRVFPKVQRWANIAMMVSVPMAVAGLAADIPLISVTGGALTGLSTLSKELVELLSSKYRWIGFVSETAIPARERKTSIRADTAGSSPS